MYLEIFNYILKSLIIMAVSTSLIIILKIQQYILTRWTHCEDLLNRLHQESCHEMQDVSFVLQSFSHIIRVRALSLSPSSHRFSVSLHSSPSISHSLSVSVSVSSLYLCLCHSESLSLSVSLSLNCSLYL